jgi:hypothetical protein
VTYAVLLLVHGGSVGCAGSQEVYLSLALAATTLYIRPLFMVLDSLTIKAQSRSVDSSCWRFRADPYGPRQILWPISTAKQIFAFRTQFTLGAHPTQATCGAMILSGTVGDASAGPRSLTGLWLPQSHPLLWLCYFIPLEVSASLNPLPSIMPALVLPSSLVCHQVHGSHRISFIVQRKSWLTSGRD